MIQLNFQDHPRGCGENVVCRAVNPRKLGSPPRMRGKPLSMSAAPIANRITPADAGKTSLHVYAHGFYWDHPRGCGENADGLSRIESLTGSPPRMRGKRTHPERGREVTRITPADAGKTFKIGQKPIDK